MDVYGAGESPIPGYDGESLTRGVIEHGHKDAHFIPETEAVVQHLIREARKGDIVITLGAGNVWQVGEKFARHLD